MGFVSSGRGVIKLQGSAVPPPPIYGRNCSPSQIVTMLGKGTRPLTRGLGQNVNVLFPRL